MRYLPLALLLFVVSCARGYPSYPIPEDHRLEVYNHGNQDVNLWLVPVQRYIGKVGSHGERSFSIPADYLQLDIHVTACRVDGSACGMTDDPLREASGERICMIVPPSMMRPWIYACY